EREVDEAGTRHIRARDARLATERRDDGLGRFARLAAHLLRDLQRDVGREVAVLGLPGPLEVDRGALDSGEGGGDGIAHRFGEAGFRIGGRHGNGGIQTAHYTGDRTLDLL